MLLNKRIGRNIYVVGKFETGQTRLIYTRNHFNFMLTVCGYGVAILRHV
jgi:hypothetical protein